MTVADFWSSDEELLAELGEALRTAEEVPRRFVDAGKSAFLWRDIDAEIATLSYDSATAAEAAGVRAEATPLRALTFSSREFTIELEVGPDALNGQVVPPQPAELDIEARPPGRTPATVPVDAVGWFVIRPKPAKRFRLRLRTKSGRTVVTDWAKL
ncbi:Uncharacterised protein [Amycolatopsis camponoti]|uniref:Uncharacterized protein n=1 Tax=Amycolatopsis camponoti TaxID=2606593 RepID=A0A6I8M7F8_9PSEU|nr:hypothetical protein [Amycolatopsis camponoti]VVJ24857.1 Uncharacterised protein [Amycolatopsis camponoti]